MESIRDIVTAKEANLVCNELRPKSGRAGLDMFKISCSSDEDEEEETYSYEFYDRSTSDEEEYSGKYCINIIA